MFRAASRDGWRNAHVIASIYAILILLGIVRCFNSPTSRAILPQLVPQEHFPSAVAWNATVFQTATILGPALGGLLYAAFRGPSAVYATSVMAAVFAAFCTLRIRAEGSRARASR